MIHIVDKCTAQAKEKEQGLTPFYHNSLPLNIDSNTRKNRQLFICVFDVQLGKGYMCDTAVVDFLTNGIIIQNVRSSSNCEDRDLGCDIFSDHIQNV